MNFADWLKHNYNNLQLLMVSNEFYRPGAIVDPHHQDIYTYAWDALGESADAPVWQIETGKAVLAVESFEQEVAVQSGLRLLGLVSFAGDLSRSVVATFSVSDVRVSRLAKLPHLQLEQRLRQLKVPHNPIWPKIDGKLVVDECYYVRSMDATFKAGGAALVQADVAKAVQPSVSANAQLTWTDTQTLHIEGDGTVPFGIRGFDL